MIIMAIWWTSLEIKKQVKSRDFYIALLQEAPHSPTRNLHTLGTTVEDKFWDPEISLFSIS